MQRSIITAVLLLSATSAAGDSPIIEDVVATQSGGKWKFEVTLRHGDEGWDHYADGWGIYSPDGAELGYRVLHHPHVDEQPFTRSLGGISIPKNVSEVVIIPKDSVHGTGEPYPVDLK